MKIPSFVLQDLLEPYAPNARYLISAETADTVSKGLFSISQSIYLSPGITSGHLNMVDTLLCFNQLAYVDFAERIRQGTIPAFSSLSYSQFKANQLHGLIYALENVKFRRPIRTHEFCGEIEILQIKLRDDTFFIKTQYDFEGSATGKISLAMKAPIVNDNHLCYPEKRKFKKRYSN